VFSAFFIISFLYFYQFHYLNGEKSENCSIKAVAVPGFMGGGFIERVEG